MRIMGMIGAAAIGGVLAVTYAADPAAVMSGVHTVFGFGKDAVRSGVNSTDTTGGRSGGHIVTAPDGSQIWVPEVAAATQP